MARPDMGKATVTKRVRIANPQGVHARPADMLVPLASKFEAAIEVSNTGASVDGKSILGILTLAAEQGSDLEIAASGPDADAALDRLVALVESGFCEM